MHPQPIITNATLGRPYSIRNVKRTAPTHHLSVVTHAPRKRALHLSPGEFSTLQRVAWWVFNVLAILALLTALA